MSHRPSVEKGDPQIVLDLAGMGGGYTIFGIVDGEGAWRLKVSASDWTPELIDEPPFLRETGWVDSLRDALAATNRHWFLLHPLEVHPAFRLAVLTEVARGMLAMRSADGELDSHATRMLEKWQRACSADPPPRPPARAG